MTIKTLPVQRFFMPEIQSIIFLNVGKTQNSCQMKQIKQFCGYGL
ncbi:hypothetical protein HMPREF0201_03095 [Cedecea davisae DSM 4568]|uniref:Uncharacterized protein n=1 Tax=Cedecea davisae DSM 4568 TaxID=566551 RepID=S3ISB4_9ENTR|nr:hypothetical protein HMPREF0201_03095 [Cedecea davisae DSM 4568]